MEIYRKIVISLVFPEYFYVFPVLSAIFGQFCVGAFFLHRSGAVWVLPKRRVPERRHYYSFQDITLQEKII